jgi:eukaryotic-like serine/threonine-protein kinase
MRFGVLLTIAFVLTLSRPALSLETSMFRANPQHTGVYETGAVAQFKNVKWKFHTGGYVVSSPAVADGTVYVGSTDGNLYAIDRDLGTQRWKFATRSRVVSSPAISNGVVYVNSYDGNFYAVDAASGKLKWKFKTGGEKRFEGTHLHGSQPVAETMPDPFDVYLSSPSIWNGAVYFGSGDGNIYALNAASGALTWKVETGDVVHASPAIADGTLFIGSWDSYFYALDAATGKQRWRFKTGEDPNIHNQVGIQSSAAIMHGMVYFGCRDSNLYALDTRTGKQQWSFPTHGSWVVSSPAVNEGEVYFATSDSGLFYVLRANDGSVVFSLTFHGWPTFSSPAIAGDMLYVGSNAGMLRAIDLQKQQVAWTFQTDGAKRNGPAYTKPDGSPNYDAAFDSDFYDDIVLGNQRMMTVGSILSSPVVAGNVIYVGSTDGNLYALT